MSVNVKASGKVKTASLSLTTLYWIVTNRWTFC